MIVIYSEDHLLHVPRKEVWGGRVTTHPEVPARANRILNELKGCYKVVTAEHLPRQALLKVHSGAYLDFLESACRMLPKSREAFPFAFPRMPPPPPSPVAQTGFYSFDTVTPLSAGTYQASLAAASCAFHGARTVRRSGGHAYCLSRPPGHHAGRAMMGGYCYLNNAALAAAELTPEKVAILDIDAHHGNGTQEIFYSDDTVLTCSIHGHPRTSFPYAWGFAEEKGEGAGKGFNLNIPLPRSTEGKRWIASIVKVLKRIRNFDPSYLIVSLGVDGLKEDNNGPFRLGLEDFAKAGRLISETGCPTLIVQEGGYHIPLLGRCVKAFLESWD